MRENDFLESKEFREQMVGRFEVLEKVKQLLLVPGTELATVNQVSEFYDVENTVIRKIMSRNEDELLSDGMIKISGSDIKELVSDKLSRTNFRGYFEIENIKFANNLNTMFTRRAILRVGMLLRDSAVAVEIRNQLLNIEEKTSEDVKVADVNEEQKLMLEVGMAYASGDPTAIMIAATNMMGFKNRHIAKIENDNQRLAKGILTWEDRSKMTYAVRRFASMTSGQFGNVWNELYRQLKYKSHIDVKARGNKPYIDHVKESEWNEVMKAFSAMCVEAGISPTEIFETVEVK